MDRMARVLLVTSLASFLSPPAWADDAADGARLYEEGWRLYQDKQYAEACPLLERSLTAAPTIRTRGALALCYEAVGKIASAYTTWKAVATQAKEAGAVEQPRLKRANQKVDQLAPRVIRVVVQVVDSPPNVQVSLDGRALASGEIGVAIPIDAGQHTIEAKAPERVDWHSTFDLGKPDEGKTRSLPVGPLAPILRVERVETVEPTRPNPVAPAPQADTGPRTPVLKYVGIATAGAGVVAIAVGTIFALSAKSKWNDAKDLGCDSDGVCRTQAGVDLVNDANSKAKIGTIGFGAGIALIAGGAAMFFLAPSPEPSKPGVAPTVSIGPGGANLGVQGSF